MAINYQRVVEESVERLSDLIRQRRRLNAEVARVEGQIARQGKALRWAAAQLSQSNLSSTVTLPEISADEIEPLGLTEAIREVLRTYPVWLTPLVIRELLSFVSFNANTSQTPLVSIHVALRRLVASGEVTPGKTPSAGQAFLWNQVVASSSAVGADASQAPLII